MLVNANVANRKGVEILKRVWCVLIHHRSKRNMAYPGGPFWWCRRCGCRFPVPWADSGRDHGPDKPEPSAK